MAIMVTMAMVTNTEVKRNRYENKDIYNKSERICRAEGTDAEGGVSLSFYGY